MKKKVTKLWKGQFVSVRDYELTKAIAKGGLDIEHNGKIMHLTPEQLKDIKPTGEYHESKFSGQYRLADIRWKPEE
tara:strand:- start:193 stop:420 length:228 start_codon:yes stop_codon:yes gene_type:complete